MDSGATHNLSPYLEHFPSFSRSELRGISLADDSSVPVTGKSKIAIRGLNGTVALNDVHLVPNLSLPLLSVAALFDQGGRVEFTSHEVRIFLSPHTTPDLIGTRKGNAWFVMIEPLWDTSPSHDVPRVSHPVLCMHVLPPSGGMILIGPKGAGLSGMLA